MIRYAITPCFDIDSISLIAKHTPNFISFRDGRRVAIKSNAKEFLDNARYLLDAKLFLSSDYKMAELLGFDGVHLKSDQFFDIKEAKKLGLVVIISTHCEDEVALALSFGADFVTYSPIFDTPNKGETKGIENLKHLCEQFPNKIIALGGIVTQKEINQISKLKVVGFASIRYFK
jgi:thiamine-phosphate pyrophosphorylase